MALRLLNAAEIILKHYMKTIIPLFAIATMSILFSNCTAYVDPGVTVTTPSTATTTTTRTSSEPYMPSSSVTTERRTTTY